MCRICHITAVLSSLASSSTWSTHLLELPARTLASFTFITNTVYINVFFCAGVINVLEILVSYVSILSICLPQLILLITRSYYVV